MKKQTAVNNVFLKNVKQNWNKLIFKKASTLVNTVSEEEARKYVQTFTRQTLTY